jgi:tetratricopeptide (TPR) repeat protein
MQVTSGERVRGVLIAIPVLFCAVVAPAALGPAAVVTQPAATSFDAPAIGDAASQAVSGSELHEWQFDLAGDDYLQVSFDLIDDELAVAAIAPDGTTVFEHAGPHVTLGIDSGSRMVVGLIAQRSGRYRLRVAMPPAVTAQRARYQLRVEARHIATDQDRQRLAVHQLWSEGMRLLRQGSTDDRRAAVARYEDARRRLVEIQDQEGEALTLGTIANLWYDLSDAKQAGAAIARSLELWQALGREREESGALSDLGLLAYVAYDHAQARSYYDRALAKHRASQDRAGEARTLLRLGWSHYAAGELPAVVEINQQALGLWREVDDRSGEATSYNDLGRAYLDLGDVSQALDAYQRSLALRPADIDVGNAGHVLLRVGLLYLSVGEWQRSLDALQQALVLARRAHDTRNEVAALANLGSAYHRFGDTGEASRYLAPALELARTIAFRGAEANVLYELGIGAQLSGELSRSRDLLQQALAIQTGIKDVRGQVITLRRLATVQLALGMPQDALESVTQSIEKSPTSSGKAYSASLTLANVSAALGNAPTASANYQQAIDRAREVRSRDFEAAALSLYGGFQARQGQFAEARTLLQQGIAIQESLRSQLVDPELRMSYASQSLTPYKLHADVLMEMDRASPGAGYNAEAFFTNERARARGLLDLLATSGIDIRQGVDPALVERERTLRWSLNAKAAIQTSLLSGKRDEARLRALEQQITDLSSALRETTTRIRQESPAYSALVEPQPLAAADVGRLLDSDTVLLEFALGETHSWVYAVTGTTFDSFALPSRQTIEDAAREVYARLISRQPVHGETPEQRRDRVAHADAGLVDRYRALSDMVLGPLAAKLAREWRGRRLAIVAEGALEYVPFGALPLPGQPRDGRVASPLVLTHEIVSLPSASILALLRDEGSRRAPAPKMVAVLADPVFAADDPRVGTARRGQRSPVPAPADQARAGSVTSELQARDVATRALEPFATTGARGALSRLPFTRMEAAAVAALAPAASVLRATDFAASLTLATSDRLADYRIVHFATHGLINSARPELSGLALSMVDARGRNQDGFLRLNTIYNLRLSADLVVLSACQSALGKEIAGEGLVGLTRGFMYAGARRVIASLWQVDDVATAELMKRFYRGLLQERLTPAAALRAAQLELRGQPQWSSPFYWAGFLLQGDWK